MKNCKKGFTLVEVIIAIAIVGMMMTSIFALLNSAFRSTYETNSLITRIFYIKNSFFSPEDQNAIQKDPSKEITKKIENPATAIIFKATKPKNKFIENNFKNSYLITATGKWEALKTEEESIIGFKYIPQLERAK